MQNLKFKVNIYYYRIANKSAKSRKTNRKIKPKTKGFEIKTKIFNYIINDVEQTKRVKHNNINII